MLAYYDIDETVFAVNESFIHSKHTCLHANTKLLQLVPEVETVITIMSGFIYLEYHAVILSLAIIWSHAII